MTTIQWLINAQCWLDLVMAIAVILVDYGMTADASVLWCVVFCVHKVSLN